MAKRDEIIEFVNKYLAIDKFEDKSANGLQVAGEKEVKKIALGVSASLALFEKAAKKGVEMIIVHHGLLWEGEELRLDELRKKRLQLLFNKNISLAGYHLPLDGHPEIGNNAQILKKLNLKKEKEFGKYGGNFIGVVGRLKEKKPLGEFIRTVDKLFGCQSFVLKFGPKIVETVGIISGGAGGASDMIEAFKHKCDVYLTGVPFEAGYQMAKEAKLNVIGPGHYNTEKFGIMELGKLVEKKFKVKTEFIDVPSPL
ncbi:MAG TPA: Nif3-like dinuclear metal center hexameric protein [Candidatus Bathyarchaeia archaeon]|nr:Nif3-like dinuclear metal center hexameric protein [Candidatus Bathyarchaeia archaeon]